MAIPSITESDASKKVRQVLQNLDKRVDETGFVDRGDPVSVDKNVGDFTTDGTWNDLDLSSIVTDSSATAILFRIQVEDGAVNSIMAFRKNGNSNGAAIAEVRTQAANILSDSVMTIPCDSGQVIEYMGSNLTFSKINLAVLGWWG